MEFAPAAIRWTEILGQEPGRYQWVAEPNGGGDQADTLIVCNLFVQESRDLRAARQIGRIEAWVPDGDLSRPWDLEDTLDDGIGFAAHIRHYRDEGTPFDLGECLISHVTHEGGCYIPRYSAECSLAETAKELASWMVVRAREINAELYHPGGSSRRGV